MRSQRTDGRWADLAADLERYGSRPWLRDWTVYAVAVYRWGRVLENAPGRGIGWKVQDKGYWFLARAAESLTGVSIPRTAVFGPGLLVQHGQCIVVHADVVAGVNCTLRQGVTLGQRSFDGVGGVPTLGDDVQLGPHCQVLGPITIGDRARLGALAVVTRDVPADGYALAAASRIIAPEERAAAARPA